MVNTKSQTQVQAQNEANAKIAELTQIKSKVATAKIKMNTSLRKLKMAVPDYLALKGEAGAEKERDAMAVVIQTNWPRLEASSEELENTMAQLTDAISKANATDLGEDPIKMIEEKFRAVDDRTTD